MLGALQGHKVEAAMLSISKAFIQQHPKQAQDLFDALVEGLTYLHQNQAGTLALAQKQFPGIKSESPQTAFERLERLFSRDGKCTKGNIERTQASSKELKIIKDSYAYDDVAAPMARQ